MKLIKYTLITIVLILIISAAGLVGTVWHWKKTPATLIQDVIDFSIPKGSNIIQTANIIKQAGIDIKPALFVFYARYTKQVKRIKAGTYEIKTGETPVDILNKLASGKFATAQITFIEGWNYKQIREALKNDSDVKQSLDNVSDAELLTRLGSPYTSPEGLFFPDTYVFFKGESDYDILRHAYDAGQKRLKAAWDSRDPDLPLKTPYDALILASIVEKETGHSVDRNRVGGVFINRLRKNMLLQTDPTVIYGMGDKYQGKIRKVDLQTDTPWNTYTRVGLPPTPIASPGEAALNATVHPEKHDYLYFVSRNDGSGISEFSANLRGHNNNVNKFILKKGK